MNRTQKIRTDDPWRYRNGLTLLELLVVLVILAVVATVAVGSLEPRVENARYEQTRTEINNIGFAAIGNRFDRQADGTPLVSGFVSDIGRLPSVENPAAGMRLSQLWDIEGSLATKFPFQFRSGPSSPIDLSDIQLPCGWRGPYLQLGLGEVGLRDAWSRPFQLELDVRQNIQSIGWDPVQPYDKNLSFDLRAGFVTVTGTLSSATEIPSDAKVMLLAPDPSKSITELVLFEDQDQSPGTFTFAGVPVGLRALCVVAGNSRVIRYVQVPHQGLSFNIDLPGNNVPKVEVPQE